MEATTSLSSDEGPLWKYVTILLNWHMFKIIWKKKKKKKAQKYIENINKNIFNN